MIICASDKIPLSTLSFAPQLISDNMFQRHERSVLLEHDTSDRCWGVTMRRKAVFKFLGMANSK